MKTRWPSITSVERAALLIFALSFAMAAPAAAQTKLGAVLDSRDRVIVTDAYHFGQITADGTSSDWEAVIVSAPNEPAVKGLRIEVREAGAQGKRRFSLVDYEELDGLSRALATMMSIQPTAPSMRGGSGGTELYRAVDYDTRGGLHLQVHFGLRRLFVTCGDPLDFAVAGAHIGELSLVKQYVDQAIALLSEK